MRFRYEVNVWIPGLFMTLLWGSSAQPFVDSWKVLKNMEDMIEIADTAQDVAETFEQELPAFDRSDYMSMRRDLRELGYTAEEIGDVLSPFEFGQEINVGSIRKLNSRMRRIKNMNLRIARSMGVLGTPDGIIARNSIESNLILQNIHQELVQDRILREKKESSAQKRELQAKVKEEKELREELHKAHSDSKRTLGFGTPFKLTKGKDKEL